MEGSALELAFNLKCRSENLITGRVFMGVLWGHDLVPQHSKV